MGAALLAFGTIVWLDHLHRLEARDFLQWWSVILIGFGLANLPEKRWLSAVILIVLGIAFLPHVPFFPTLRASYVLGLWPLLITVGGATLIAQALRPTLKDAKPPGAFRAIAVMGGSNRSVASSEFVGGDVFAVMGGCDIDLRNAKITREAVIDVVVFWGGIEIKVPPGWRIENRIAPVLGAVVDKTSNSAPPTAPVLVVRGSAIMGGIEIREAI